MAVTTGYMVKTRTTLAADHSYVGFSVQGVAGEAIAIGNVCYFKSDAKWWLADADASATASHHLPSDLK